MERKALQEIIACLPTGRTVYHYFTDRYAIQLLTYAVGHGREIRDLRATPFARLLEKPHLRRILKKLGNRRISAADLWFSWPREYYTYRLTLGRWGSRKGEDRLYRQTSRAGDNLVLRLNFCRTHNRRYKFLLRPTEGHPFECGFHPVDCHGERTLAWSRMDIALNAGEALIEEIQSDWITWAQSDWRWMATACPSEAQLEHHLRSFRRLQCRPQDFHEYMTNILKPHARLWDEAMLSASLFFLREELGIRRIFYHDYATGNRLKRIRWCHPPRSVYTELPRRFCFQKTYESPDFLTKRIRKLRSRSIPVRFQLLEL